MATITPTIEVAAKRGNLRRFAMFTVAVLMGAAVGMVVGNQIGTQSNDAVTSADVGVRSGTWFAQAQPETALPALPWYAQLQPEIALPALPWYAQPQPEIALPALPWYAQPQPDLFSPELQRVLGNGDVLTRAQAADAARMTALAQSYTEPNLFSPEAARLGVQILSMGQLADAARMTALADRYAGPDLFSPEAARLGVVVGAQPDLFSPEAARLGVEVGHVTVRPAFTIDEATSGLAFGTRHESGYVDDSRWVGESDGTLEETRPVREAPISHNEMR